MSDTPQEALIAKLDAVAELLQEDCVEDRRTPEEDHCWACMCALTVREAADRLRASLPKKSGPGIIEE